MCLVLEYYSTAYLSRSRPQTAALRRGSTSGLLLIGYFEGTDSERGIGWRANDLLALRQFLRIGLEQSEPDHSTRLRPRCGSTPRRWGPRRGCGLLCGGISKKVI
ncbi:MAG: transposase [Terriglobia bacterium]